MHEVPPANLFLVLWACTPAHGPPVYLGSLRPLSSLPSRWQLNTYEGHTLPVTKAAPGQRASQSPLLTAPPTPAPGSGLSLMVLQPKSRRYHLGAGRRGELTQLHSQREKLRPSIQPAQGPGGLPVNVTRAGGAASCFLSQGPGGARAMEVKGESARRPVQLEARTPLPPFWWQSWA